MTRGSILAATGAGIFALLLGCGGSELSRADFVKQADAACATARHDASKKLQGGPGEDAGVAVAAVLNKEADEIGALDGPNDDADQIEAIVSGARKGADAIEAKGLDKAAAPLAEAEKLAGDYGLDECLVN